MLATYVKGLWKTTTSVFVLICAFKFKNNPLQDSFEFNGKKCVCACVSPCTSKCVCLCVNADMNKIYQNTFKIQEDDITN